jgi:hypothetical protein
MTHLLYKDGDPNAPDSILDSNGQVVLGLCRICGAAEAELETSGCVDEVIRDLYKHYAGDCINAAVRMLRRMERVIQLDHAAEFGLTCPDEGCPHYGTPHGHPGDQADMQKRFDELLSLNEHAWSNGWHKALIAGILRDCHPGAKK